MKKILFLTFLAILTLPINAETVDPETHVWTSTDGHTTEARLVKATAKSVSVELLNGKTVTMKLNQLSEEDRTYVSEWLKSKKEKEEDEKKLANLSRITYFRWEKSYKRALEQAKKLDLPVAILFTGTSWCGYCIKLENEVFSKKEFRKLAPGVFIGVKIEAPSSAGPSSKEGKELAKKFGILGYPSIIYVDKEGNKIGQSGYSAGISPQSFLAKVKKLK